MRRAEESIRALEYILPVVETNKPTKVMIKAKSQKPRRVFSDRIGLRGSLGVQKVGDGNVDIDKAPEHLHLGPVLTRWVIQPG